MGTSHKSGAIIEHVQMGSPADRAGLRVGDLITAANGVPVRKGMDLRDAIILVPIGDEVKLLVTRSGSDRLVAIRVEPNRAEPNPGQPYRSDPYRPGMSAPLSR
jgi:S1-C subfamily serine protease